MAHFFKKKSNKLPNLVTLEATYVVVGSKGSNENLTKTTYDLLFNWDCTSCMQLSKVK